eukprot:2646242-Prymnesium_polylepis.1
MAGSRKRAGQRVQGLGRTALCVQLRGRGGWTRATTHNRRCMPRAAPSALRRWSRRGPDCLTADC